MRTRFLDFLARCFNAHLADNEKRFADDVREARRLAVEFNAVIKRINKNGDVTVWYTNYPGANPDAAWVGPFSIHRIDAKTKRGGEKV
jgi:cation transport regulator ChaB